MLDLQVISSECAADVPAHISAPYLVKLWPVAAIYWPRPANILKC